MRKYPLLLIFLWLIATQCLAQTYAQEKTAAYPFLGVITGIDINVRQDATTSSQIICKTTKGDTVEVILEKYEWYKIRLPKDSPSFIKKTLISPIDEKTAKSSADKVNVRLSPKESAPILGQINKNEIINVLEDAGQWVRIAPIFNSFGWVNKKFITKADANAPKPQPKSILTPAKNIDIIKPDTKPDTKEEGNSITIEGIVQPYGKVINRTATHKLISANNKIFLLKGNPENLNTLTYHKVRITAKPEKQLKEKYPVLEVIKMEGID